MTEVPRELQLARLELSDFAEQTKRELLLDRFDLWLERDGTIALERIQVPFASRQRGAGSEAMRRLVAFADAHHARIGLSPANPSDGIGTSSRSRLIKFYKRFGFVENKGRTRDFSTSWQMLREPRARRTNPWAESPAGSRYRVSAPPAYATLIRIARSLPTASFGPELESPSRGRWTAPTRIAIDLLSEIETRPIGNARRRLSADERLDLLRASRTFKPIELEVSPSGLYLLDGNHRLHVARERGERDILAQFFFPDRPIAREDVSRRIVHAARQENPFDRAWIWRDVEHVRERFIRAGYARVAETSVVIDPSVDTWEKGERTVASCEADGSKIYLSPRIERFDEARRRALIAHELGHAVQGKYATPISQRDRHDEVERDADRIAEEVMGQKLYYTMIDGRLIQTFDPRDGVRPRPRGLT